MSATLIVYLAYGGREIKVPELVGKTQAEAQEQLRGLGLKLRVTNRDSGETPDSLPIGEQDPRPGMVVKTGQSVRVILGESAPDVVVEPTAGKPGATKARPAASPRASVSPKASPGSPKASPGTGATPTAKASPSPKTKTGPSPSPSPGKKSPTSPTPPTSPGKQDVTRKDKTSAPAAKKPASTPTPGKAAGRDTSAGSRPRN
ncbi:MAG: PASTA domain-containing protein [Blastocatellia bacterium]